MNIQTELQPKPLPSRSTRAFRFFVGLVMIVITMICGIFLLARYDKYQNQKAIDKMNQAILAIQNADYEEAMKDTYGGKTPQETLSLYIIAVEKGDYELASKYFIGTKQKEELESLKKIKDDFKKEFLDDLKVMVKNSGVYSLERDYFTFDGDILINTKKYPNSIWKIIEI